MFDHGTVWVVREQEITVDINATLDALHESTSGAFSDERVELLEAVVEWLGKGGYIPAGRANECTDAVLEHGDWLRLKMAYAA